PFGELVHWCVLAKQLVITHQADCSQLTIQGTPKRSVSMPKRIAQKVCWIGICTEPLAARAWKMRSAWAGSLTVTDTEKPLGMSCWSGGLSEPIKRAPSTS